MNLVNLTINGKVVSVPSDTKILEAAKQVNIKIPSLCHLRIDDINFEQARQIEKEVRNLNKGFLF